MNAPDATRILADIREADRAELDRIRERKETEKRLANEAAFEATLKDYIFNRKPYLYGGVVNLLSTVEKIMDEVWWKDPSKTDYETAANHIRACAKLCDLRYGEE